MERLLIIDDDPAVLGMLRECLEACGYDVMAESDPTKAVELAMHHHIDLVLCDACMPGMTGHTVTERLRANPAHGHTPIIIMSGAPDEPQRASLADHFLQKPFMLPEVLTLVGNWLRDRRDSAAVLQAGC